MVISIYLSIITSNENGLNSPIKRHRVTEWMKNKTSNRSAASKRLTSDIRTHIDYKGGDGKRYYMVSTEVATLISDKIHFKTKTVIRDKEGYYIMIKGLI